MALLACYLCIINLAVYNQIPILITASKAGTKTEK